MASHRRRVATLGGMLSAIILVAFHFASHEPQYFNETLSEYPTAIGTKDDPAARANFEWMRLRDPNSGAIPRDIRNRELAFAGTLPTRDNLRGFTKGHDISFGESWAPRGPVNIGGRTRALAVDVSNENVLIAGGVSGGLWRSTDNGSSWTKVTTSSQLHLFTTIAQDTRLGKTSIWYAGTGENFGSSGGLFGGHFGVGFLGDGIFKSTDGGVTWSQLPNTVSETPHQLDSPFDFVTTVTTDPVNTAQDVVYAAAFGGIYRSVDGGSSWSLELGSFSSSSSIFTDVAISPSGVLYAVLSERALDSQTSSPDRGVYRSTAGTSWTEITPPAWPTTYRRIVVDIAPSNENVVYFAAHTPGSGVNNHNFWKYTYISGDGSGAGGQWENRSANLPAEGEPVGDFNSQSGYDLVLRVKPDNENVVFLGGTNLYRSDDGFATANNYDWIGGYHPANMDFRPYNNHHPDQHAIVFKPSNPSIMYSGHDGGVGVTNNNVASNVTWVDLNNGYVTSQFYAVAIDHTTSGSNRIVGGMQDNSTYFTSSSSVSTDWAQVLGGDGAFCAFQSGGNVALVSTQEGTIFKVLLDDAGNINGFARVDPTGGSDYLFITPFLLDPNDRNIMYLAAGDRIWRNHDLSGIQFSNSQETTSTNWTELTNSAISGHSVTALGLSETPSNRLYYGTIEVVNGQIVSAGVFRLDDAHTGNPNPADISSGLPAAYINCIAVDPEDHDRAVVVFSNYNTQSLFYTEDGGTNWQAVSGNLEENPDGSGSGPAVLWVEILAMNGSKAYFAATSTGLYSTTNLNGASTTWIQEGAAEIGNVIVDMVDARANDGLVVAATHGLGVFSNHVVVSVEEPETQTPQTFRLAQNFPNPFNPTTTIEFSLAKTARTAVKVYNIYGQQVATLLDEQRPAGTYSVNWDGQDASGTPVASGVYYYQITAGDFVQTRKMTLLR